MQYVYLGELHYLCEAWVFWSKENMPSETSKGSIANYVKKFVKEITSSSYVTNEIGEVTMNSCLVSYIQLNNTLVHIQKECADLFNGIIRDLLVPYKRTVTVSAFNKRLKNTISTHADYYVFALDKYRGNIRQ